MEKHFCPYCMTPVKEGEPCEACGLTAGTYSPSPHHLPPGTILMDRYLVGRVLGEGGFGITYIGCDLRLELKVAIKEYFPSDKVTRHAQASLEVSNYTGALAGNYERGKEKYLQEARTMARMNKQAEIVSVRDFFETNNTAYIVMEYVEGTTFKELVSQKGGRIPAGEFFHTIEPLFFALEEMHSTGLIHRDISPDNLMLENGSVRLLDFGCARESAHGTETMTIALKHGYAPIEQYQHKGQGPWTDVYALCATMYYCLTGKVPQQSIDRLCEDELILPKKLGVDLTENQERALLYGMGIRPRRRYQSIQELYAALYTGVPAPKIEIGQSLIFTPEIGQPSAAGGQSESTAAGEHNEAAKRQDQTAETSDMPKTAAVYGGQTAGGEPGEVKSTPGDADAAQENTEAEKKKKTIHQIKIAAASIAIIGLIASPFILQEKLKPALSESAENPVQSARGEEETEEIDLFAEATPVKTASETALRVALNGSAKAVIWDNEESITLTGEPLVLTKPLYIGEKAHIEIATQVTVEDGGHIRVAGELHNRGFLQAKGDGQIVVEQGGRLNGQSAVFVEKRENLTVKDGGTADIQGADFAKVGFDKLNYVVFSENAIFADAAHVRTGDQLQHALNNDLVTSIIIDRDITLEENFRYMDKNVMVSEGVTLTASRNEDTSLCFDGATFVNYGTVSGRFQVGDWNEGGTPAKVFNYGQISDEIFVESDCNIVNLGQMNLGSGWTHVGRIYNLGEFVHDDSGGDDTYLEFLSTQFVNLGTLRVEGDASKEQQVSMDIAGGTEFINFGIIEIGTHGTMRNQAVISGFGEIFATDGTSDQTSEIWNDGIIRLEYESSSGKAGGLHLQEGAQFGNEGFISWSDRSNFNIPGEPENYGGAFIPFAWGDNAGDFRYVFTAEELKEALDDNACGTVIVVGEGGDIVFEEELVVTKGLAVAWPATLCFTGGGLKLTGEQAYLYDGRLNMNGNAITVSDGATLHVTAMEKGGYLYAQQNGKIILHNFEEDAFLPDTSIVLDEGCKLLSAGYNKMEGRTISVKWGSVFRIINHCDMVGCNIGIERGGELLTSMPYGWIDENTRITNNGVLELGAWEDCICNGEITNNNEMRCYVPLTLDGGRLINNGDFWIDIGDQSIRGDGVIKNNGTIASPRREVLQEFRGSYSGNEVQYTE